LRARRLSQVVLPGHPGRKRELALVPTSIPDDDAADSVFGFIDMTDEAIERPFDEGTIGDTR
jgi:hypothetical protein